MGPQDFALCGIPTVDREDKADERTWTKECRDKIRTQCLARYADAATIISNYSRCLCRYKTQEGP
jgi:hypothetical protein